jgi:hypothetical protein
MPTRYKPVLDHEPLAWTGGEERAGLADRLEQRLEQYEIELAQLCGAAEEDDDLAAWRRDLRVRLLRFMALCRAEPLRSPNKVLATLKWIERSPEVFLDRMGKCDPVAMALWIRAFTGLSRTHQRRWLEFESGSPDATPSPWDVSRAAREAMTRIVKAAPLPPRSREGSHEIDDTTPDGRREMPQAAQPLRRLTGGAAGRAIGRARVTKTGRPADCILDEFARMALRLFRSQGRRPSQMEEGRFWRFVDRLRSCVLPEALQAGSTLTVDTVVRRAIKQYCKRPVSPMPERTG